jgi:hypothetical protein
MSVQIEAGAEIAGGLVPERPDWFEIHLSSVTGLAPGHSNLTIGLPLAAARSLALLIEKNLHGKEDR